MASLLYEVSATDKVILSSVCAVLLALAAAFAPARRSWRADPMAALREE